MKKKEIKTKKVFTRFHPLILSRHPSHAMLRKELPLMPFRSIIRLGSTTTLQQANQNRKSPLVPSQLESIVQINTVEAIQNSANKFKMKTCFTNGKVKTANWVNLTIENIDKLKELEFPIVAKHIFGSRGEGNTLIKDQKELTAWCKGKTLNRYIFEAFHNYAKEYRLHVTEDGCFYTCRKVLKHNTPDDRKWFRNDSNCTWILETNKDFERPSCWKEIEKQCIKALKSCGLDFGACDVKVQAETSEGKKRKIVDFIVIEINSAPSYGTVTAQKYLEELPKLLTKKKNAM